MNFSNHKNDSTEMEFSDNWMITYSDMITIVLCFFVIFFSLSSEKNSMLSDIKDSLSDQVSSLTDENTQLKKENNSLVHPSKEDFISFLTENNLLDKISIFQSERGLAVRFNDSVLFTSGEAEISKDGSDILNKIGSKLKLIPNSIIVEGFTDNVPIHTPKYPSNWELSVARSINVVKFLTDEKLISQDRVSVSGFGEQGPIDTNDTASGRANNRRIEITIVN
ncbi:flagellar motor protein MotB [Lutibacter sp. B2]|nr:flagellar motor protein MotB [Lutibacter sp. B2]